MAWLTKRASELAVKHLNGLGHRDDARRVANTLSCGVEALARQFAERALKKAIPYDTDHPNYSSEAYEDEIAAAIAEADKP